MKKSIYQAISDKVHDPIQEWRNCRYCASDFAIAAWDVRFYEKVSPTFWWKKYPIPSPTLCPDCRQKRRLSFHNERKLYKGRCDATGKDIISAFKPENDYTVYHQDYYWSDAWDPMMYGKDVDISKSFFGEFKVFSDAIPKQALVMQDCENSEYLNFVYKVKNCYLIFAATADEDCYYGNRVIDCKDCIDSFLVKNARECYECTNISDCFGCYYCENITDSRECEYLFDSVGCAECFMSTNLRNKRFYIKNKEYLKEEYYALLEGYKKKSRKELEREFGDFLMSQPHRANNFLNTEQCFGENLQNTKNAKVVFDGDELHDVAYSYFVDDVRDAMDVNYGQWHTALQYEALWTGANANSILFSINIWPDVDHLIYCDTCRGCSHCFGCIWLRNKSYCILNKQYTREEYEELVPRIIEKMRVDGEWWEFFPSSMSPFGYNETVAHEYYPLSKIEALKDGVFKWNDYESPFPKLEKIIPGEKLPDDIKSIPDDILNWAIKCEVSWKLFRIIRQELEFYRKHSLPVPRRHPDQRHMDRMNKRNPRKLFEKKCDKCSADMITSYSTERSEKVYCEECYEKVVVK